MHFLGHCKTLSAHKHNNLIINNCIYPGLKYLIIHIHLKCLIFGDGARIIVNMLSILKSINE